MPYEHAFLSIVSLPAVTGSYTQHEVAKLRAQSLSTKLPAVHRAAMYVWAVSG
jgi:hypothetical protein